MKSNASAFSWRGFTFATHHGAAASAMPRARKPGRGVFANALHRLGILSMGFTFNFQPSTLTLLYTPYLAGIHQWLPSLRHR